MDLPEGCWQDQSVQAPGGRELWPDWEQIGQAWSRWQGLLEHSACTWRSGVDRGHVACTGAWWFQGRDDHALG